MDIQSQIDDLQQYAKVGSSQHHRDLQLEAANTMQLMLAEKKFTDAILEAVGQIKSVRPYAAKVALETAMLAYTVALERSCTT